MTSPETILPSLTQTPRWCDSLRYWSDLQVLQSQLKSSLPLTGPQLIPYGEWCLHPETLSNLLSLGVRKLSFPSIKSLSPFKKQLSQSQPLCATSSKQTIFLEQPVTGEATFNLLSELSQSYNFELVFDHYSQVADYARVAVQSGICFPVLLNISLTPHHAGCRPGTDVRELIKGLKHLQGVSLAGITGELGDSLCSLEDLPSEKLLSDRKKWVRSRIQLLNQSRLALPNQSGIITIQTESSPREIISEIGDQDLQINELRIPLWPADTLKPLSLMASVLSRPSLEVAFINLGRKHVSGHTELLKVVAKSNGRQLPDAEIVACQTHSLKLLLGPLSRDLLIGDQVLLYFSGSSDQLSPDLISDEMRG